MRWMNFAVPAYRAIQYICVALLSALVLSACSSGPKPPPTPEVAPTLVYSATFGAGGLTATNKVKVSWKTSPDENVSYEIVRSSDKSCDLTVAKVDTCADYKKIVTKNLSVNDRDLPWGNIYRYAFRVVTNEGGVASGYSPIQSVSAPAPTPTITPTLIYSVTPGASDLTATNSVDVSWAKSPVANVKYEIVRSSDDACDLTGARASACANYKKIVTTNPTVDDRDLSWGYVYRYAYRVIVNETDIASGYSPIQSVSAPPPTPQFPPALVYSVAPGTGDITATNSVNVSWAESPATDATYEIVRTSDKTCDLTGATINSCGNLKKMVSANLTLDDPDLPWGNVYRYAFRVLGNHEAASSAFSPFQTVSVPVLAPRVIDISMSGTSATLSWDSLPGVSYSLLLSKDANCDSAAIEACEHGLSYKAEGHELLIRHLDVGSDYYFWVKADNNEFSDTTTDYLHKFIEPFSPVNFTVQQLGRDFQIKWDSDRNSKYSLWRWEGCSSVPDLIALPGGANSPEALCMEKTISDVVSPFLDDEVEAGGNYYYALQAYAGGKSAVRSGVVNKVLGAPLPVDFSIKLRGAVAILEFTRDVEFPGIEYTLYRSADKSCKVLENKNCAEYKKYSSVKSGDADRFLKGNQSYAYWLSASIGDANNITPVKTIRTQSILVKPENNENLLVNSDGKCLVEPVSGLRWAILDEVDGVAGGMLTDPDDRYIFSAAVNSGQGAFKCGKGAAGSLASSCTTADLVQRFNQRVICGRDNWRLPTLTELMSVIDYSHEVENKSAFRPELKPSLSTFEYWSSDVNAAGDQAISLDENGGMLGFKAASTPLKVRLVSPGRE